MVLSRCFRSLIIQTILPTVQFVRSRDSGYRMARKGWSKSLVSIINTGTLILSRVRSLDLDFYNIGLLDYVLVTSALLVAKR